jgi:hypothetical protein
MATRKSTRSGGQKTPPRRGNEIRTHPLSKEEGTRWKRAYKKLSDETRKPFVLDRVLANLCYEYLIVGVYLSDKIAFKTRRARTARKNLESACSNILSAIHLLSGFIRKSGVPTSPLSILRDSQT